MPDRLPRMIAGAVVTVLVISGCAGDNAEPAPATAKTTAPTTAAPPAPKQSEPAAKPASLSIPSLDLDEKLIGLDLEKNGSLEVPKDPGDVGWYVGGGRPGGPGPTVLAGHVDSKTGPAVFYRLTELEAGDTVMVDDINGKRTSYVIDRVEDYPKNQFPTEKVFGSSPDDQLRLITCTGVYDRGAQSHRDNLVVFASAVDG